GRGRGVPTPRVAVTRRRRSLASGRRSRRTCITGPTGPARSPGRSRSSWSVPTGMSWTGSSHDETAERADEVSYMTERQAIDFLVERGNLRHCKFVRGPEPDEVQLRAGEVLLEIAKFAFTANNVTYAVAGDMMSYWSFFPAEAGWARAPV